MPKMPTGWTPAEKGDVLRSPEGLYYKVTDAQRGKVKRVTRNRLSDFVNNTVRQPASDEVCTHNTNILYHFLRSSTDTLDALNDMDFKRGIVRVSGYKVVYESHGFRIIDDWNFGKKVNVNKYHNDYPRPEDVLAFLSNTWNREIDVPNPEAEETDFIDLLSTKFKVTKSKKDVMPKVAATKENPSAKNLKVVGGTKSKTAKTTPAKPEKVVTEVVEKEPTKKKAPKFIPLELENPIDLQVASAEHLKMAQTEITYAIKGPSGKKVKKTSQIYSFLTRQVLHYFPKAMPLIMKIALGEIENVDDEQITDLDRNFLKDPFQDYDSRVINQLTDNKLKHNLAVACEEILAEHGVPNPLNRLYNVSAFKVKDRVRIFMPDSHAWFYADVISTEAGLEVRFDDGSVDYIYKHQSVEKWS